jgi:rubrerythrin
MHCGDCGLEKDPSLFYKSNKTKCKECVKVAVKKNREANIEYYREFDRKRSDNPDRVAARKLYQSSEIGKIHTTKAKRKWLENNPKKRAVHIKTGNAIRDGILIKEPCEVCGQCDVVAHHKDYDNPLDVTWLCPKHHSDWHKENGEGLNAV